MDHLTLSRLRSRRRLSQAGLARLLGISTNSVARMERNETRISEPMARLILFVARDLEDGSGTYAEYLSTIYANKQKKEKKRT